VSLNAVEAYVQGLLQSQVSALFDPAEAWVQPPTFVFLTTPQIFVWGGDFEEERHTLDRGRGEKRTMHQLTLWLQAATSNDIAGAGSAQAFPVLIDAVRHTLRTTPLGVTITDPVTGETSVIQTIGERMRVKHPAPTAASDQSFLLWHAATITVFVTEEFVG
jgi:hypothetical protein